MPESMIERVARALCILAGRNPDTVDRLSGHHEQPRWHDYIEQAHTAITAMREPTDAMAEDGAQMLPGQVEANHAEVVKDVFRSMIDAGLNDDG